MNKSLYDLRPLQNATLLIFREFANICRKHGLKYYAMYGTALGAVRHKGFIPWDDDLDVAMPRPDYSEFVKIVGSELPPNMKFLRGGENPLSPIYQGRIVNTQPDIVSVLSEETNIELIFPPFVDVFILDGVPRGHLSANTIWGFRRRMRLVQMFRYHESMGCVSTSNKIKRMFARFLGMCMNHFWPMTSDNESFMKLMDAECSRRFPYGSTGRVAEVNFFRLKEDRVIEIDELEPAREVQFEDTVIRIPAKVEEILRRYYGDFMKYPEKASQVPAHQLRVMYKEHI